MALGSQPDRAALAPPPHPGPLPEGEGEEASPWQTAVHAAALAAIDPLGTGGIALRAGHGPVRTRWLALLRGLLPEGTPWRKLPPSIADARLLGGLDLAATLQAGRPVMDRGLLAEAEGGIVLLAMAERAPPGLAARLAAALDNGHGPALVALDEGASDDERTPPALLDRLAFHLNLAWIGAREPEGDAPTPDAIAAARDRLPAVRAGDAVLAALCGTAMALGVASVRAPLLALRVARAAAALAGRDAVSDADAALACRLVLAPRATMLPVAEPPPDAQDATPPPHDGQPDAPPDAPPDANVSDAPQSGAPQPEPSPPDDAAAQGALQDILLEAARAAIPPGLLTRLQSGAARNPARSPAGVAGAAQAGRRGRPAGIRPGDPRGPDRINLIETLRAAAPWQRLRGGTGDGTGGLRIRRDDFRVTRMVQRAETTTIFVVDASGSSAFNRLAEAKGAVELLLAECYIRRDRVAVVAFRGKAAELLLPPTRSLVRAKRGLAGLPGGGGTPLAAGIDAGFLLADAVRRRGGTPSLVLLTDGRGNVAQDGRGGRDRAQADAMQAARQVRAARVAAIVVDTSPRPGPAGQRLAAEMGARYVPLPYANAAVLTQAVRGA